MPALSFEFFPPRDEASRARLDRVVERLAPFGPDAISVTCGAGGTARSETLRTLDRLRGAHGAQCVAHLCYSGVPAAEIRRNASALWERGHRRVLALRGDHTATGEEGVSSVPDFVRSLKAHRPFEIGVACYPDVHPRAESAKADLDVLLAKQEAGATYAVTQFFFRAETYLAFKEDARAHGVTIPIIPGVLPIHDIERAIEFGDRCGSRVPQWVRERFLAASRTGQRDSEVSSQLLRELVTGLLNEGVADIHVYALNRASLAEDAASLFRERFPLAAAA